MVVIRFEGFRSPLLVSGGEGLVANALRGAKRARAPGLLIGIQQSAVRSPQRTTC